MKNNLIAALLLCCSLLCFKIGYAQTPGANSPDLAATTAIQKFTNTIGKQSWLYNGPVYDLGKRVIQGNPNFLDTTLADKQGSVVYYGFLYKDVPLTYDIRNDMLVTTLYDDVSRYCLINGMVSEFTIFSHRFIRLNPDTTSNKVIKPGFYDEVYNGKLQVLVKPTKFIHVARGVMSPDDYYESKTYYYLKKNGIYHAIASEGDMLDILADHKKELKKYIRDNRIKFKEGPADVMFMLAAYYDKITN